MKRKPIGLLKSLKQMRSKEVQNFNHLEAHNLEQHYNQQARSWNHNQMPSHSPTTALANVGAPDYHAPSYAANMDFLISRPTANIASTGLPVALFGTLDFQSDYINILPSVNAVSNAGNALTYTVLRTTDRKSLKFTYTEAVTGFIDVITVSCNQYPYYGFIQGMNTSVFQLSQIKLQISDVTVQTFFSNVVQIWKRSQYGKNDDDKFTPNSFKSDLQNQNDIRTINNVMSIDSERTVTYIMPANVLTVTMNCFMHKFEKTASANNY